MRSVRLLSLVLLAYAVAPATAAAQGNKAPKFSICHATGDGAYHLININGNAVPAHLAHGDQYPELVPLTLPAGTIFNSSASADPDHLPAFAFDGDATTGWNAGVQPPPPQWIQVTFPTPLKFNLMTGLVDQTPAGPTNHNVTFDGVSAFSWTGNTSLGDVLSQSFGAMQNVQRVRITTTASPSWVAWFEITLYDGTVACPGS